jgi:hypothetical protein
MRRCYALFAVVLAVGMGVAGCGRVGGSGGGSVAGTQPPASVSASAATSAEALPTKADLAARYTEAVKPYNEAAKEAGPIVISKQSPLPDRIAAAARMAEANWATIEPLRVLRTSIEPPPSGYPADGPFYRDLHAALGSLIDGAIAEQGRWAAMQEAKTPEAFDALWRQHFDLDDGATARKVRSLLGLPDIERHS